MPESFAGRSLWLHVRTQIDEWDDAKNPQFLLFVNDEIVQGMDMNHREVLLTRASQGGGALPAGSAGLYGHPAHGVQSDF